MLILLTHVPAEGLKFEHQYQADELDLAQHEFSFRQPPLITGRVTILGQETRVKGKLTAQLEAVCDRCLEPVALPVEREFDLFYLPEESYSEAKGETELLERDLDFSFYQDERIDIDELVLEQLELSLPTRILCQENCQGLCPQCGTNLNLTPCNCQTPMDPRWQALADLK
jgi:uncharacterized protein